MLFIASYRYIFPNECNLAKFNCVYVILLLLLLKIITIIINNNNSNNNNNDSGLRTTLNACASLQAYLMTVCVDDKS